MMSRKKAATAVLAAAAGLMISGCRGFYQPEKTVFEPDASCIYVAKDGTVSSATVERYDKENYSEEAFREFILGEVAAFNERLGAPAAASLEEIEEEEGQKETLPVAVVSCSLGDGRASVVYHYADTGSFLSFAEEYHDSDNLVRSIGIGSAAGGKAQGWFQDGDFVKAGTGTDHPAANQEEIEKLNKERMVLVETDHTILLQTEGEILFMTDGVALSGEKAVQIPKGKHYIVFK